MEKWKKRTVELVAGLALSDKKYPSVVPYYPKKTHICPKESLYFSRVSPDKEGISTATLRCMLSELESEMRANIHSLLVLSHGGVICRCAAPGYDGAIPHLAHSMSKTVTGMAIGFLVSEGRLSVDTPLSRIFPEYTVSMVHGKMKPAEKEEQMQRFARNEAQRKQRPPQSPPRSLPKR